VGLRVFLGLDWGVGGGGARWGGGILGAGGAWGASWDFVRRGGVGGLITAT